MNNNNKFVCVVMVHWHCIGAILEVCPFKSLFSDMKPEGFSSGGDSSWWQWWLEK